MQKKWLEIPVATSTTVLLFGLLMVLMGSGCGDGDGPTPSPSSRSVMPSDLEHRAFTFADGAAFSRAGVATTLTFGAFMGNRGIFSLQSSGLEAKGHMTIGSCDFMVETSAFLVGQGPQAREPLRINPCDVDMKVLSEHAS